ncbi:MAG: twin arginine-targeting protein translocase TatC [Lysobacterales bacterium 69-70]|nr:twin-arginine translocase subunit TatC [Xanthomonadaceae bacterium]ODU35569.1 MAG: twin arginine-targeting protein translocase TatC [Xanthomonadaceae bacterium SCN 69-320]ODV22974.1 MAG: twin arginine-targeting protein translocase TatC [Xanthomonadaceae bacterium SCN 69-25]OJY96714.1 MAG: twin arginine-targeting protein translocase TatC [Xanthomonadales bacterium 69-70]
MSATEQEPGEEASFFSHLIELRERLLKAVLAVGLVLLCLLPFANKLYAWLAEPLLRNLPAGGQLVAIEVASPFFTPLKLAFCTALVVAMPVVLYQLWAFVAPGLYRHEKRLGLPLLVSSVVLFYLGGAFAYFLVLPMVFSFLARITPQGVAMMTDISKYLDFVLVIFFAFGLCFEVPVAVVILVALGWVTPRQLTESRGYVIVGAFVVAAILTPPDVVSQILLAIPMCLLYEVGIVAARAVANRPADTAGRDA